MGKEQDLPVVQIDINHPDCLENENNLKDGWDDEIGLFEEGCEEGWIIREDIETMLRSAEKKTKLVLALTSELLLTLDRALNRVDDIDDE